MKLNNIILACTILLITSCNNSDGVDDDLEGCSTEGLLESFSTPEGDNIFIYQDGKAFLQKEGTCTFALQYFDPDFLEQNYVTNASGTFIKTDEGVLFSAKNNFFETFESYSTFTDLFIKPLSETNVYWNRFTLQSPAAPTVADYNALRACILDNSCTFKDNKIELIPDPTNLSNQVLKFTAVAPTADMVTSKSSIQSTINYFEKGSEVWLQADFYIESGIPFSLVDFENSYFEGSPRPRVVIRTNKIEFENKFGAKTSYKNSSGITLPQKQWFTLKIHLKYSNENNGIIELWQDGVSIISTTGINLPSSNSIQNRLEIGISATSVASVLLLDNMRISDSEF